MPKKSLAAGASPQTPIGELIAFPQPPVWIQREEKMMKKNRMGTGKKKKREGKEKKMKDGTGRKKGREREEGSSPHQAQCKPVRSLRSGKPFVVVRPKLLVT